MSHVFEKRSRKAEKMGFQAHYQISEDGTQIWLTDRSGKAVWERRCETPEAAFSHMCRWLSRMDRVNDLLQPQATEDDLGARLDLIAMRLSALIDRADAISAHITTLLKTADKIFDHAEHVLQELS